MKQILLSSVCVLAFVALSLSPVLAEDVVHGAVASPPAPVHEVVHWGYVGEGDAPHWGGLEDAYSACGTGQAQSPVNIARFLQGDLPDLQGSYVESPLVVVNNGHTIQVNFEKGSGFVSGGVSYNLLQAHFHTPSEHYLDGAPYPMEAHFVHRADDGRLAVIAVLMKVGAAHRVIEGIWQNVPPVGETKIVSGVSLVATDLMPEGRDYYKYDGSLTTPPCSEGVAWHVLKETITLSEEQLRAFQAVFPVNSRPVQPLNGREITGD